MAKLPSNRAHRTTAASGSAGPARVAFIVGTPRSGTTLLAELLARSADVHVTAETHFFRLRCRSVREASGPLAPGAAERVRDELRSALELPRDEAAAPSATDELRPAAIVRRAFAAAARLSGRALLVEKTPDHALRWRAILHCFPAARFVHLVRDPRDVALSWRRVPWWPGGYVGPAWRWRRIVAEIAALERACPDRLLQIRYEDLVERPEATLRDIRRFLEIGAVEGAEPARAPKTFRPEAEPWKARAAGPVSRDAIGKWRRETPAEAQYVVERIARRGMARYGYPREAPGLRRCWRKVAALLLAETSAKARRGARRLITPFRRSADRTHGRAAQAQEIGQRRECAR